MINKHSTLAIVAYLIVGTTLLSIAYESGRQEGMDIRGTAHDISMRLVAQANSVACVKVK